MTVPRPWTVLAIDDQQEVLDRLSRALDGANLGDGAEVQCITSTKFTDAMGMLDARRVDLLVLDLLDELGGGDDAGREVFEALKSRIATPVVFYTGNENRLADIASYPLVWIVPKHEGTDGVVETLTEVVAGGLPSLVRGIDEHVRALLREFFWGHVQDEWGDLALASHADRAAIVVQRLAKSLDATRLNTLQGALSDLVGETTPWHAAQMYVVPPLSSDHESGDVCWESTTGRWSVILTPACDLTLQADGTRSVDWVTMAEAVPLSELPQGAAWRDGGYGAAGRGKLETVLKGGKERYFYLPKLLHLIPHLVVDLERVHNVSYLDINQWARRASLAAPYSQVLLGRHARFMGRLGYENVPVDDILAAMADGAELDLPTPSLSDEGGR